MKTLFAAVLMVGCAQRVVPQTVHVVLQRHVELVRTVQACEKKQWPVYDETCRVYARALAFMYVREHPDYFGPDVLKKQR